MDEQEQEPRWPWSEPIDTLDDLDKLRQRAKDAERKAASAQRKLAKVTKELEALKARIEGKVDVQAMLARWAGDAATFNVWLDNMLARCPDPADAQHFGSREAGLLIGLTNKLQRVVDAYSAVQFGNHRVAHVDADTSTVVDAD